MGKSHHHEWINRRSHFAWSAAQLCYWTRLTICSIAVAVALAWTGSLAAAQQEVCKNLDAALKDEKASPPKLNELAATPSPMRVKTSEFASGSAEAIVTFEDSRIGTDMSKVCVKAFARLTRTNEWEPLKDWEPATVRRVFVTEKAGDTPRRLNVVLKIEEPKDVTVLSPSRKFDYLLVGVLGDTSPISFSYAQTISVMSKSAAVMLAVLFVLGFYLFLVYITYNDDTRSLDGPGWFAYTFQPHSHFRRLVRRSQHVSGAIAGLHVHRGGPAFLSLVDFPSPLGNVPRSSYSHWHQRRRYWCQQVRPNGQDQFEGSDGKLPDRQGLVQLGADTGAKPCDPRLTPPDRRPP
jgi:hypothetical protein